MSAAEQSLNRILQAIADPTRRRILQALKQKEGRTTGKANSLCASDIEQRVRLSQPTISHHMAILVKAGLVEISKQGQWRWYRRNGKTITRLARDIKSKL